jgi:phosphorylase kinase alpha/beta subunit
MSDSRIAEHLEIIRSLQSPSGLFLASAQDVPTGYNKAWLRDNFYTVRAFQEVGDWERARSCWRALLSIFLKHEEKIQWAAHTKPLYAYQYIHARYHPETFEEFWEDWGNKQNDAVGAILFAIGELEDRGQSLIESEEDKRIVQRLVDYLGAIEYWHDPDNGVWEENEEVHSSSVGACVAGLRRVRSVSGVTVPNELIERGELALRQQLPRESITKFTDLALLSLIYPFQAVGRDMEDEILKNLEYHLVRKMGVMRYRFDRYYNRNPDGYSEEAEWTMGFPWLSIIYAERGDREKAMYYLGLCERVLDAQGKLPELYYSNSAEPNENTPLGWAESLYVIALLKTAL